MLLPLVRQTWAVLLAVMPRRLLASLDGWARERAQARADRRRRALMARMPRG